MDYNVGDIVKLKNTGVDFLDDTYCKVIGLPRYCDKSSIYTLFGDFCHIEKNTISLLITSNCFDLVTDQNAINEVNEYLKKVFENICK